MKNYQYEVIKALFAITITLISEAEGWDAILNIAIVLVFSDLLGWCSRKLFGETK